MRQRHAYLLAAMVIEPLPYYNRQSPHLFIIGHTNLGYEIKHTDTSNKIIKEIEETPRYR